MKARYLNTDEYDKWDNFVSISPQGNIFNKSYWLKLVSSEFKILVVEENGKIIGGIALPSLYNKIYRNPKLTPQLGVLFFKPDGKQKYPAVLSKQNKIFEALIEGLPKFYQFDYTFSYNCNNFLPLIWNGFDVKVRYTYVIEDLTDIDKIKSDFQYDVKYMLKKADKSNLILADNFGIKEFYEVNKKTFDRQGMDMPYTLDFLTELDETLAKNNSRKMLFALNEDKRIVAGVYLIYDENSTYYLMGGADPEYRNTGAQTFLIWEGIKFASSVSKKFDFEGSMIKSIESSFREFGGRQKIIHNVYKSGNKCMEFAFNFAKKNKKLVKKFFKV